MEPDHLFSLEELWPLFEKYGREYSFDPKVLAGVAFRESAFKNYLVHGDLHGRGLFGMDPRGVLTSFESRHGLNVGRWPNVQVIPVELQVDFAAYQLKNYQDTVAGGDSLRATQAWHRGSRLMDDAQGVQYSRLIQGHIRDLFPGS